MKIDIQKKSLQNQVNNLKELPQVAIINFIKLLTFLLLYSIIIYGIVQHFLYKSDGIDLFLAGILSVMGIIVSFLSLKKE